MMAWETFDPSPAIAFLAVGIGLALVGVITSVLARKPDLTLSQLFWAGSNIAAHPERYVREECVGTVRALNLAGVLSWLVGVGIILFGGLARVL